MSEDMSHEQYVLSVRRRIVSTAQAMRDAGIPYLRGARELAALRHDAEIEISDTDFLVVVAIDSETDDFPLGLVRERWNQSALEKLPPQIVEAEEWAKTHAEPVRAASGSLGLGLRKHVVKTGSINHDVAAL
jgi:hypothetical protein